MAQDYITVPTAATLTESELFKLYLDAPVRLGATTSVLAGSSKLLTAREHFLQGNYAFAVDFIEDDFTEVVLLYVESHKFPSMAMRNAVGDLSGIVEFLTELQEDFGRLADITRVDEHDDGAPKDLASLIRKYALGRARYVLPSANVATDESLRQAT